MIFPLNIAAEASAISSASPALQHSMPYSDQLLVELVHGREPDGDEKRVDPVRFLGARDGLEIPVDAGDRDPLELLRALRLENRVRGEDRHAETAELVEVDLVAAALRAALRRGRRP